MKVFILTIFLTLLFTVNSAYGCSLLINPIKDFDESEYIFIGEVIGYIENVKFNRNFELYGDEDSKLSLTQASGLIVKVKASVNLPKTPKTYFEVFPYELGSMCEDLGVQQQMLEKNYPKNSEVLVVAREATQLPHILSEGNFRLEDRAGARGLIALNANSNSPDLTTVEAFFDYKKNVGNYSASVFEGRKDLLRLKKAETEKERRKILERLLYFHKSIHYLDLYSIFRKYYGSSQKAERLYRKNLRFSGFSDKIIEEEINRKRKLEQTKSSETNN